MIWVKIPANVMKKHTFYVKEETSLQTYMCMCLCVCLFVYINKFITSTEFGS